MASSGRNPTSTYGVFNQPYTITGDQSYQSYSGNTKLERTQKEVDQVTNIMRENMAKAMERDAKLSEMDERAAELQIGAQQFQTTAHKVQRKYWWKNIKMWVILIAVLIVVIAIIAVAIYFSTKSDSKSNSNTPSTPSSGKK